MNLEVTSVSKAQRLSSIGVEESFEANHVAYESTRFDQVSQVSRNFYGKTTWSF